MGSSNSILPPPVSQYQFTRVGKHPLYKLGPWDHTDFGLNRSLGRCLCLSVPQFSHLQLVPALVGHCED